jgi:hypothetical protein
MNPSEPDDLAARLEALSAPRAGDEAAALWRAALDRHRAEQRRPILRRIGPWAGLAAACLAVAALTLPFAGKTRRSSESIAPLAAADQAMPFAAAPNDQKGDSTFDLSTAAPAVAAREASLGTPSGAASASPAAAADAGAARLVARRADVSLLVPDVREGFLRAQAVVRPARGEVVEASTIAGEGPDAAADCTLRVAAERFAEVLDELRGLGEVARESASADDVTSAAIDLDARLRDARRVEADLLERLERRTDAPPADALRLRASLDAVRTTIERDAAQREALARRVDLATVRVTIRAKGAASPGSP